MLDVAERHPQKWVAPMLELALVTGQRRSDLAKMAFTDVQDGYLRVEQYKTGERIMLPLDLRLKAIDLSIGEAIEKCRDYKRVGRTLLRAGTGEPLSLASLSICFREVLCTAMGGKWNRQKQYRVKLQCAREQKKRVVPYR
jgi:integrase